MILNQKIKIFIAKRLALIIIVINNFKLVVT